MFFVLFVVLFVVLCLLYYVVLCLYLFVLCCVMLYLFVFCVVFVLCCVFWLVGWFVLVDLCCFWIIMNLDKKLARFTLKELIETCPTVHWRRRSWSTGCSLHKGTSLLQEGEIGSRQTNAVMSTQFLHIQVNLLRTPDQTRGGTTPKMLQPRWLCRRRLRLSLKVVRREAPKFNGIICTSWG